MGNVCGAWSVSTKLLPHIDKLQLLHGSLECWAVVVASCVISTYHTIKVSGQYCVRSIVTEVICDGLVEEVFSFCSVDSAAMCVAAAKSCVVNSHRNQATV